MMAAGCATTCSMEVIDRSPVALAVEVGGEIDIASRPELRRLLGEVLDTYRRGPIVIDLSAVTFADSTLAWLLIELDDLALTLGTRARATGASPTLQRLLRILELDHMAVECLRAVSGPTTRA
jgi:anti-anti-sigma factor